MLSMLLCYLIRKSDLVIFVTRRNSLHYCYDVSYQCWFTSEEAKIYCYNFNSSNAVLILAYYVRLAVINAAGLERNGCFSLPLLRNVVLWLKRISTKSLQLELVGGQNLRRGGPYPLADLDGGEGRRVQCRVIQWSSDSFHCFNSTVLHSMIR